PATPGTWDSTQSGLGDGFLVKLAIGADVAVKIGDVFDPVMVPVGGTATAKDKVEVRNNGPLRATGVQVPIRFRAKVKYKVLSAEVKPPALGTCVLVNSDKGVDCSFPILEPGASASVNVTLRIIYTPGIASDTLVSRVTASANEPDPEPKNNKAETDTKIIQ